MMYHQWGRLGSPPAWGRGLKTAILNPCGKLGSDAKIPRSSERAAEYLTFVAASGAGGVEAIYADENVWLSQKMMALLYDVEIPTVNYHLRKVFEDSELQKPAVVRNFRITAPHGKIQKFDVVVAKNYLTEPELAQLSRLVSAYLDVAEDMALRKIPMTMQDWETRLNRFLAATDREVLQDSGKVTAEIAKAHAESEFEKHRIVQDRLFQSDFDRVIAQTRSVEPKTKRTR
jgi:hypothetical protein